MSTKRLGLIAVVAACSLQACVTRANVATIPVVSTTDSIPATVKPKALGKTVNAKYCAGDKPALGKGDHIGWIDEVTHRAQKSSGARYIKNARYTMELKFFGSHCILLSGEGWK